VAADLRCPRPRHRPRRPRGPHRPLNPPRPGTGQRVGFKETVGRRLHDIAGGEPWRTFSTSTRGWPCAGRPVVDETRDSATARSFYLSGQPVVQGGRGSPLVRPHPSVT
jgi:hypothetical protein